MNKEVRTRIAPSPTGLLHVGTARTALFNELFAKKMGGKFILRFEDTDEERSKKEYENNIIEGLKWLGLSWHEGPDIGGHNGPYRQSERANHYASAIQHLLNNDLAYVVDDGEAIKLRVSAQDIEFTDLVRGKVRVHSESWGGDFVIARSLINPVFHLAVVVDDAAQNITHVIRGEDHLSNTARHILLQRALGLPTPEYAHLPLLLDDRRRKLSKRSGETDFLAYRKRGYLPDAMLNYLAMLGWNPKNDQEIFSHQQLIKFFDLTGIQKGGAIFSLPKLNNINQQYIRARSAKQLYAEGKSFLIDADYDLKEEKYWLKAIATEQARIVILSELPTLLTFFKKTWPADYPKDLLIWKKSDLLHTVELLHKICNYLKELNEREFTKESLERLILNWIDNENFDRASILWPARVALTGEEKSPSPFEVAAVLGKVATVNRLEIAIKKLS